MIAGMCKSFNLKFDYVLYEMSYANVLMYSAVLPSYEKKDKEKKKKRFDASKDANNPSTFKIKGREVVKR